jgi:hypothetical protein
MLYPGETVEVLVKFTEHKGIYLFHCHNLEHEDDGMMMNFKILDPIGIEQIGTSVPEKFALHQNYPNPFNPSTKIKFDIPASESISKNVNIKIFDISGREVKVLYNGELKSGSYETEFDASGLSSGVYFCSMIAGNFTETIKLILSR